MSDTVTKQRTDTPRDLARTIGDEARAAQDAGRQAVHAQARRIGAPLAEARVTAAAAVRDCQPALETILGAMPADLARLPGPDAESLREIRMRAADAQMLCGVAMSMFDAAEQAIARVKTRAELWYIRQRVNGLVGVDATIRQQLAHVQGALDLLAQRRAERDEPVAIVPNSFAFEPPPPPRSRGVRASLSPEDRR